MSRELRHLGAAGAAALGADLLLPAGAEPGLRGTLIVLPIVAALFAILARRLEAPAWSPAERWLGVAWLASALAVPALGLPGAARLVVGGFIVLVAWRGVALLPFLRRRSGRGAGATWPFALLPFTLGLACLPWTHALMPPTGDEPYYLLLSESLASDLDLDLSNQYASGVAARFTDQPLEAQFVAGREGEQYSRHGVVMPLLLAPFWKLGGAFGARLALVLVWSLLAERLYRLLLAAGIRPRGAFRAWGVATFAVPLLPYSRTLWIEAPAAFVAALALEAWLRLRSLEVRPPRSAVVALVLPLAALPMLKLRLLALAAPLALLIAIDWPRRDRRRWWALGAVAAVALGLLAVNALLFARPLGPQETDALRVLRSSPGHYLRAFVGLCCDSAFGLLPLAPLWLLALPGAAALLRRQPAWRWAFLAGLPYLVLVLRRDEWYGGWCPPFRYLVVLLPWLAVALGVAFERPLPRLGRRVAAALLIVTAAAAWAVTFEPNWSISPASGRSDLLDILAAPFGTDLARFAPSAIRPRLATWLAPALALVAAIPLARGRRGVTPALLPIAAATVLLGAAAWVVAADRVPTRVAEAEDPWVRHRGGDLYPDEWIQNRTRFDGGWILPAGGRLELAPRAGGDLAEVEVRWRTLAHPDGPGTLALALDDRVVRRWRVEPGTDWRVERIDGVAWRPGAQVELRFFAAGTELPAPAVIDRLEFAWR